MEFEKQVSSLATFLGYETKKDHCRRLYNTIQNQEYHPAFYIDDLQRVAITFHSSKGLEFDQVIVFVSDYNLNNSQDIYNHYVAGTRAKSKLIMVYINEDRRSGKYLENINMICSDSNLKIEDVISIVDG